MAFTQTAAFVGVALAGAAYVPQIWHLVRTHCAAGISRFAFRLWLAGSLLVTSHAISTQAWVFVALGTVQTVATTLILIYATRYATSDCGGHGLNLGHPETGAVGGQPSRARSGRSAHFTSYKNREVLYCAHGYDDEDPTSDSRPDRAHGSGAV